MLGAHHEAQRSSDGKQYMELIRTRTICIQEQQDAPRQTRYLPMADQSADLCARSGHNQSNTIASWQALSFPCTAGARYCIDVPAACALVSIVMRWLIAQVHFDMEKAWHGLMQQEVEKIKKDRCDCIHGCFVGSSLQHSPKAICRMYCEAPGYSAGMTAGRVTAFASGTWPSAVLRTDITSRRRLFVVLFHQLRSSRRHLFPQRHIVR